MVERLPLAALLLRQVVCNVLLEVCESSIGNEDVGERAVAFFADAQEFDLLGRVRQTLERQRNIRLAGELNL